MRSMALLLCRAMCCAYSSQTGQRLRRSWCSSTRAPQRRQWFAETVVICSLILAACMPSQSDMKRILVVDDDPHIREILIQRLRTRGWVVEGAESGEAAIGKFAVADYDLLILDLMIGATGGNDVFLALQRLASNPRSIGGSAVDALCRRAPVYHDATAL